MKKINVAIIGYGLSGKSFHAPLIKACSEMNVVAVVSSRKDEIHTDFPAAKQCSFKEALEISDLVIITTPHQLHFEQAKAALEAGKHVVVEKPFTATTSEASQLFDLAKQKKRCLKVFFNRRYDADFLTIKEIIKKSTLGEIITIESHFDRFRPTPKENAWREKAGPQSGIWWDLGPHLIDQGLQLFGKPEAVVFDIARQRAGEADDFFDVTMKYSGARRIHLRASCVVKDFGFRFRIHGTKGSAVFKQLDVQESMLKANKNPLDHDFGLYPKESFLLSEGLNAELIKGDYLSFYKNLLVSIKSQTPDHADLEAILWGTNILNLDLV